MARPMLLSRLEADMAYYGSEGDACGAACGYCGRCTRGPAVNAICVDCGAVYFAASPQDQLCDECCDRRDDWTTTHELKAMKGGA